MKIDVKNVDFKYESTQILKNINFSINKGEIISLIGPSGCGKTTILKILLGFLKQSCGKVSCNPKKIKYSYMPQEDNLLSWKSIQNNIILPCIIRGEEKQESIQMVLKYQKLFGLTGKLKCFPSQISVGMKKRAALFRTFLVGGSFWLLDEPFSSLDEITRAKMQVWLLKIQKKLGVGIIIITHSIREALLLSKRVYVLGKNPTTTLKVVQTDLSNPTQKEMIFKLLKN